MPKSKTNNNYKPLKIKAMFEKKDKTIFIEYSNSSRGQHFMTVVQVTDGQKQIIGRIYRSYNQETKKTNYRAEDWMGNRVFVDIKDLSALKQNFKENGKNLAMIIPKNPNRQAQKEQIILPVKSNRVNQIKQIREKKSTKDKTEEVSKTNPNQKDKAEDSKNPTKFKDIEKGREDNQKENTQVQETAESNSEKQIQEEPEDIKTSEREAELDQLRNGDDDREQEQEQEMELEM